MHKFITLMRLNICVDEDVRTLFLLPYVGVKDDTCEDTARTAAIAVIRMKAMMSMIYIIVSTVRRNFNTCNYLIHFKLYIHYCYLNLCWIQGGDIRKFLHPILGNQILSLDPQYLNLSQVKFSLAPFRNLNTSQKTSMVTKVYYMQVRTYSTVSFIDFDLDLNWALLLVVVSKTFSSCPTKFSRLLHWDLTTSPGWGAKFFLCRPLVKDNKRCK